MVDAANWDVHRERPHIVILGAGISGLWAAYALLRLNPLLRITVLEKQAQPGGLFSSSRRCDYHFNHGLFLFSPDSPLIALMPHRFTPVKVRYTKIVGSRSLLFPVDPVEMKVLCRAGQVWPYLRHMAGGAVRKAAGQVPSNLDEWLEFSMPGSWSRRLHLHDYIYKLMGYEPSELSSDVGIQRLAFITRSLRPANLPRQLSRRLRLLAGRKRKAPPLHHLTLDEEGTGGFIREFAGMLSARGVRIAMEVRIRGIEPGAGGIRIGLQGPESMDCDALISTIPVTELARYRSVESPAADVLKWRSIGLFFFKVRLPSPDQWLHVVYSFDRNQCWKRAVIRRIDGEYSVVRVEVTGDFPMEGLCRGLMARIRDDLSGILSIARMEDWVDWDFLEVPSGYPCMLRGYRTGYEDLARKVLCPGMFSLGRQGSHCYATSSVCAGLVEKEIERIYPLLEGIRKANSLSSNRQMFLL